MQILRQNLARFLIVTLVGVWSHAAYQDCLAFMVTDTAAAEAALPPCHTSDTGSAPSESGEQAAEHDCLGACDCGLQAVPVPAKTLPLASEYKPVPDDNPVIAMLERRISVHHAASRYQFRHEQPAAACLHPHQKYCVQLK
jgi:hypothetical protein